MVNASPVAKLFTPLTLGGKNNPVQLLHRVVMAPLTRLRSGEEAIPPSFAAKYYAQRSTDGGLLIAEGTNINPTSRGYFGTPGLYNQKQVDAWKSVTKAVHDNGGKIFVQLWHTGRVNHPLNQPNGVLPVSSSAASMDHVNSFAVTREGRKKYVAPRALEIDEIPGIVEDYRKAAVNAIEAGFDGVELHAANGYLLEQFLCDSVNQRTDQYGGCIENRARFLFEALEAILSSVDSSKVAIRLSPFGVTFGCTDSTPEDTYGYVVKKLNDYDLAYVHVVEPGGGHHAKGPLVPETGVTAHFRPIYNGVLITASGYNRESADKVVEDNTADLVAFGRDFIGTPDLVKRLQIGAPLNKYDNKTFYLGGEEGYTDYPFLHETSVSVL